MIAYLSGPIENAENDGVDWRNMMTEWLSSNLNHKVFDPVKETKSIIDEISMEDFRLLKTKDLDKYKNIFRKIIKIDLEAVVNEADYLIVKWDESVFRGGGTHGEITMAYWLNKPVYLVNSLPINDVSSWVLSCSDEVFDSFDSLKKRLSILH